MECFSQRRGLTPLKKAIQADSIDVDLRNSLWNALYACYFEFGQREYENIGSMYELVVMLYFDYFKYPIDSRSVSWSSTLDDLRKHFFNCQWYGIYDFIEFVANQYNDEEKNRKFMDICNRLLEREFSAYRFVGGRIAPITSEVEISEVDRAIAATEATGSVDRHLQRAIELLADRNSPDYRNSIKESICAVECMCRNIIKNDKVSLGEALNIIEKEGNVKIHGALDKAFSSIYGYTSDAGGIRHAFSEGPAPEFEEAKFMLVACSAFVNYLIVKSSKAGIKTQ